MVKLVPYRRISTDRCCPTTSQGAGSSPTARQIDPKIRVRVIVGDVRYQGDASALCDADFLFLATDTALARFAFNALCHQYLIPGVLVGAKVAAHPLTGSIESIHVVERPVTLDGPCSIALARFRTIFSVRSS